jgi:hypothetical protein
VSSVDVVNVSRSGRRGVTEGASLFEQTSLLLFDAIVFELM